MAKIEINLTEYNSLKERIKTLEKFLEEKNNEIRYLDSRISTFKRGINSILSLNFWERTFMWIKTKNKITKLLNNR